MLRVNYVDTGRKDKVITRYGFLIEEDDAMAARNGTTLLKIDRFAQPNMEKNHMTFVALFEYFIGNTDWAVPGRHNVKIIYEPVEGEKGHRYAVPYDFDYTGFVNASYAKPPEGLPIEQVRERLFLGYCKTPEQYQVAIDRFLEKKEELYQVIEMFPYLNKGIKKSCIKYLDEFFKIVNHPKVGERYFSKGCKS